MSLASNALARYSTYPRLNPDILKFKRSLERIGSVRRTGNYVVFCSGSSAHPLAREAIGMHIINRLVSNVLAAEWKLENKTKHFLAYCVDGGYTYVKPRSYHPRYSKYCLDLTIRKFSPSSETLTVVGADLNIPLGRWKILDWHEVRNSFTFNEYAEHLGGVEFQCLAIGVRPPKERARMGAFALASDVDWDEQYLRAPMTMEERMIIEEEIIRKPKAMTKFMEHIRPGLGHSDQSIFREKLFWKLDSPSMYDFRQPFKKTYDYKGFRPNPYNDIIREDENAYVDEENDLMDFDQFYDPDLYGQQI